MAAQVRINKKCINDPLYTPVERFLKERIAKLEIEDPDNELPLAKERYTGLVAGDLVIENPVAFPDGITRVCFTARKTGFARVDVDITRVEMKDILADFAVPLVEIEDVENLKAYVKANPTETALLWCKWLNNYGVLLNQESAKTFQGPMKAFGELFFSQYQTERESLTFIDYDTLESGTVTITDASFGTGVYPLFIYELVLDEANVPGITSNLPESITTQRGQEFSIPNTYWFNTTIDITHEAEIEISTGSGYTIPKRSEDGNFLIGETIYGSATEDVEDQIFVRVTYMWNGRPVKKTFTIEVKIEKDNAFDLTFKYEPATIEAPNGSEVQVKIFAFYKDEPVTIGVPPATLHAQSTFGNMNFVSTEADGGMLYSGILRTNIPNTVDKVGSLYTADFIYNGEGGVTAQAPAYVNVVLVRSGVLPTFQIRGLTSVVRGYKDDKGEMEVSAFYGDDPISATKLDIVVGNQGDKNLIRYDSVVDTGIKYTLIRDANKPGQEIEDTYKQRFRWISPTGTRYTIERDIRVVVEQKSVYEVKPRYPNPLTVVKYQTGFRPFILILNGEDVSDRVNNYGFVDSEGMITHVKGNAWEWIVSKAPDVPDADKPTTVPFTFRNTIDGKWVDFKYDQQYLVKAWKQDETTDPETDPGVNTDTVAVPAFTKIDGLSDETGVFDFRVYHLADDITSTAVIMNDKMITPDGITFDSIEYVPADNVIRVKYTKVSPTDKPGKIYICRPGVDPVLPTDTALVNIATDVKQSRILILKDYARDTRIEVAKPAELAKIELTFAGQPISLLDPNLSYKRTDEGKPDAKIESVVADGLMVYNNYWRTVGTTRNEFIGLEYTYVDPLDPTNISKVVLSLPVMTVYPEMKLVVDSTDVIEAAIWDTGELPMHLQAGDTQWNGAVTRIVATPASKYFSFTKPFNYEVVWAEKEVKEVTVDLEITWTVGDVKDRKFTTQVKFKLAEWDQITFGGDWVPKEIQAESNTSGTIVANFVYKGQPATKDVVLVKASSTIPDTLVLGVGSIVEGQGLVVGYETTRGGIHDLILVYRHTSSGATLQAKIPTNIAWPHELNLDTMGKAIKGYWDDTVEFPLVYNFDGVPVALTDPNMTVTVTSGESEPVALESIEGESLLFKLVRGGSLATDYEYTVDIKVKYIDSTGKEWKDSHEVPATVRIPEVKIKDNPTFNVKVWERGKLGITLVDERGKDIAITGITPVGTNPYISFIAPDAWYVINGNTSRDVTTELATSISYSIGGRSHELPTTTEFVIQKYDGKKFVVTGVPEKLEGKAGVTGIMPLVFTNGGDPVEGVTIDLANSTIPANIVLGEIDPVTGELPYTLVGQAKTTLRIRFMLPNAATPPVADIDMINVSIPVITTSSDEVFTLTSSSPALTLDWMETGTVVLAMTYGTFSLPPTSPGLKYTLSESAAKSVRIIGPTATGLNIQAIKSNVSGAVTLYPEDFKVEYEVGAPVPKQATWTTNVTIQMGVASVSNNDVIKGHIWDRGPFSQSVLMGDKPLNTVDHYESLEPDNEWVEFFAPRSWEMINAEKTVSTHKVKMRLFYKVDAVADLQTLDFDATFEIGASSDPTRFTCLVSPTKIDTAVGSQATIKVRPVYKGKDVGGQAIFKQDLSTIPKQIKIISSTVNGIYYDIVVEGTEAGLSELELVFWAPGSVAPVKDRDVWKGKLPVKVLGELGVEIGDRDNLLVGKHEQTGDYKLEVLFGGILLDVKQEVINGALKFSVEPATNTNGNAGTLNLKGYNKDGFKYELLGPVSPAKTVKVSDFLNVVYIYGGTAYSRRVEIPEEYTSGPIVPTVAGEYSVKIWQTGQLVFNKAMCDGVDLTVATGPNTGYVRATLAEETPNGYITVVGKGYNVINADEQPKTLPLEIKYSGRYRMWDWSVTTGSTWKIAGWNQKTLEAFWIGGNQGEVVPSFTATGTIGGSGNFGVWITNQEVSSFVGLDLIDYLETDFHGAIDIKSVSSASSGVNGKQWTWYSFKIIGEYKGDATLIFRKPDGAKPGVEFVDWTSLTYQCDTKQPPLVITNTTTQIQGGNQDIVPMPFRVNLVGKPLDNNDPNLKITLDPTDIIAFKDILPTTSNVEFICPLTQEKKVYEIKVKFTYTNPVGGTIHTGEYVQRVNVVNPKDWPIFTGKAKRVELWQRGAGSDIFSVVVNGKDIVSECKPISIEKNNAIIIPDDGNPNGDWYWCVGTSGSTSRRDIYPRWTLSVPFRGEMLEFKDVGGEFNIPSGTAQPNWISGTAAPNPFELTEGKEGEIKFALTRRGAPEINLTLNVEESSIGTYIEILSQTPNPDDNTITVKYKAKDKFFNNFNFVWDYPGVDATNLKSHRGFVNVRAYAGPKIESTGAINAVIWQIARMPVKVTAAGVDITTQCTWTAVSDPRLKINTPSNTSTGPQYQVMDCPKEDETVDVTWTVMTPASAGSVELKITSKVTFKAWDGVEFKAPVTSPATKTTEGITHIFTPLGTNIVVRVSPIITCAQYPAGNTVPTASYSVIEQGPNGSKGLMKWVSGDGDGSTQFATFSTNKIGKELGTFNVNYAPSGNPNPNGYPHGTVGKNRSEVPVLWEVFEPVITWKSGKPPEPIVIENDKQNGAVFQVPLELVFGPTDVAVNNTPANTVALSNANGAVKFWGENLPHQNWGANWIRCTCEFKNNGSSDVESFFTLTIVYTYTNGVKYTFTYDQPIIFKGKEGGVDPVVEVYDVTEVNAKVWERKTGLPFKVRVDGVDVALSPTTIVELASKDTPWLEAGPLYNNGYRVISGDPEATTKDGKFAFSFRQGPRLWKIEQDVTFNIEAYQGNELVLTLVNPQSFNKGITQQVGANTAWGFSGTFRGETLSGKYNQLSYWPEKSKQTQVSVNSSTFQSGYYQLTIRGEVDSQESEDATYCIGFANKVNDPNAVEGVDFVIIKTPTYCYSPVRYYPISGDTVVEGVAGTGKNYQWHYRVRKGLVETGLGASWSNAEKPSYFDQNPRGIMEVNGPKWADTRGQIDLKFASEIPVGTRETDAIFTIYGTLGAAGEALAAKFPVKLIQHTNVPFPTVEDATTAITTHIHDEGPLPFRVDWKGEDVTSQISEVRISANSYVELKDGKWYVKHADLGEAKVMPTFEVDIVLDSVKFTLKQEVTFTIIGWSGKEINAKVEKPLVLILGEVGYINITGDYSGDQLAGNVTFDVAKSDNGGLVTFGAMTVAGGGNLAIKVTGATMGTGSVVVRLRSVHDTGNDNVGSDWIDLTIPTDVVPEHMTPIAEFETQGEGNRLVPPTLKQAVLLDTVQLANTVPGLQISLSGTDKVAIDSLGEDTITYKFLTTVRADTTHTFKLKFLFKGKSEYSVDVTLVQKEVPAEPIIVDIQPMSVVYLESYGVPFRVIVAG